MIGGSRRVGTARLAAAMGVAAALHCAPAVTALPRLRTRLFPRLSGLGDPDSVALTFDDGPHPASTPHFVEALAAHRVRATFFLLGSMLARNPELGRELVAAGHEVAVHGWGHRNLLLERPRATYDELARAYTLIAETTGTRPRFFRPPYGVLSMPALLAARRLELTPVLWTRWGKEWSRSATLRSVRDTLTAGLTGGATVLLHDCDTAFAAGSWRFSLAALPLLFDTCAARGLRVGPLSEHWCGAASCW
jgi:peptidoglycan/xylan/chitin deacetylase (PgdA/CDA1 family)